MTKNMQLKMIRSRIPALNPSTMPLCHPFNSSPLIRTRSQKNHSAQMIVPWTSPRPVQLIITKGMST